MKHKGYFLVLATAVISGFSIFINKFGVAIANPYIFAFLKNFWVVLFLSAILFAAGNFSSLKKLNRRQWGFLMIIGLIGGSIPFLLFFKGLSLTTASGASFIQKTMFIWIFILAWIFLKEKITKRYIIAGLLLMGANMMLLKLSDINFDKGSLFIFMATFFWALENVISKYIMKDLSPKIVMWGRMFFGSLFILIFLVFTHQAIFLNRLNPEQISWTLFTGIILLAYVFTWYSGLKHIKVSEAAIILMLGSPITTMLTVIFSKPATLREYLASGLIIFGVLGILGADKFIKQAKRIYVRS